VTYSHDGEKEKEKMSFAIVVSFAPSSKCAYKIVRKHTFGSMEVLTELVSVSKAGMKCIPDQFWKEIFGINGTRETVDQMVNGNKRQILELNERELKRRNKEKND
jgi:hypothetical protein